MRKRVLARRRKSEAIGQIFDASFRSRSDNENGRGKLCKDMRNNVYVLEYKPIDSTTCAILAPLLSCRPKLARTEGFLVRGGHRLTKRFGTSRMASTALRGRADAYPEQLHIIGHE